MYRDKNKISKTRNPQDLIPTVKNPHKNGYLCLYSLTKIGCEDGIGDESELVDEGDHHPLRQALSQLKLLIDK